MKSLSFKARLSMIFCLLMALSVIAVIVMGLLVGKINNGTIILLSRSASNVSPEDISQYHQAQKELNYNNRISYTTSKGERVAVIQKNSLFGWNILSISIPGENPFLYSTLKQQFFVFILIWITMVCALSAVIAKNMTFPFRALLEGIQAIEQGNLDYAVQVTRSDEIGQITESFNLMTQSLKSTYNELEKQTAEIFEKNRELRETNQELEASYEQLQATLDQLGEAEDKYYSLVKNIPEIVCVIDHEQKVTFVNSIIKDILGYDNMEIIGNGINMITDVKDVRVLFDSIYQELQTKPCVSMELPLIKKNDERILAESKFTRYVYQGNMKGIQAVIRDITSKREMEKEILQKNKEMAVLHNLSKSLNSTIELDKVLRAMVTEISGALGVPMVLVQLLDGSGNFLKVKAFAGSYFNGDWTLHSFPVVNIYNDVMGQAVLDNIILHTPEIQESWFMYKVNRIKEEREKVKDLLFIPLANKDKKLGLLVVGSNKKISDSEISLLNSIANNASVAIDNAMLYHNSKKNFVKTIDALIAAVEAKDKYTQGHSQRVSKYAVEIARYLGLDMSRIEELKIAGILHDIGKIGISDNILLKEGPLTNDEYSKIKEHPMISKRILLPVGLSDRILNAIECHHERYDGRGYPNGFTGDKVQIEAQIISVADAFDAMTSNRSYRKALSPEIAIKELIEHKDTQFNGEIVDVMREIFSVRRDFITQVMMDGANEIAS